MKRYQCVLITGASSGIGTEIARRLAPHAEAIVLVGRRTERLAALATELSTHYGSEVVPLTCDLSQEGNAEKLWEMVIQKMGNAPDLLVNNAGMGLYGETSNTPLSKEKSMVTLNVSSLMILSKLALKVMSARRQGVIMNVASIGSFHPGPYMSVYYATKAFVLSYTEAIAEEARHYGVRVIVLCPGSTQTDFHATAGAQRKSNFCKFSQSTQAFVAEVAVLSILNGYPDIVIPGWKNKVLVFIERFIPRFVVAFLSGRVLKAE
ncbi:MAG: SDR family oxidoreductase [Fibrobacteraceae bacterium]